MASASYLTEIGKFSRSPVFLVKLTVTGDIAGTQVFRFTPRDALHLTRQLGFDTRPYLISFRGRATRIAPDRGLTERQRTTLTFADDPNAPAFDSTVFTVVTGGSFFRRLVVAQPDYVGSQVEVLRGFVLKGFVESDFETIFKGRLEDINFQNDNKVSLVIKENSPFVDRQVPAEISDNNILETILSVDTSSFDVTAAVQITDPADLASKDFFPVILRIGTEDIIIKSINSNTIEVQDNYLKKSEQFDDTDFWVESGAGSVSKDADFGPFGGFLNADRLTTSGVGTGIKQNTTVAAASETFTFSIWMKSGTGTTGNVLLRIEDAAAAGLSTTKSVTAEWQRFEMTHTFSGGSGNVTVLIVEGVSPLQDVLLFGAQLEKSSTRGFYVGVDTVNGAIAGRGVFGSTKTTAVIGTKFKEVAIVRQHLDQEGISPIVALRDLLNKGETVLADIDQTTFDGELNFSPLLQCIRASFTGISDSTIVKPKNLLQLIKELRDEFLIDLWMGENGKLKTRFAWKPLEPHSTISTLKDKENIIENSASYKSNKETRATRIFVYFGKIEEKSDGTRPADFFSVFVESDAVPESLSGKKAKRFFSRWIFREPEAQALAGRYLARFKRGAQIGNLSVELKEDPNIPVGEILKLNTSDQLSASGTSAVQSDLDFQLTQKTPKRNEGKLDLELMQVSPSRHGFIAHSGTPDFDSASVVDKQHCFIGTATTNKVGAAAENGYVTI